MEELFEIPGMAFGHVQIQIDIGMVGACHESEFKVLFPRAAPHLDHV
jgi:hypothetical protein